MEYSVEACLGLVTPQTPHSLQWTWHSLHSYRDRRKEVWLVWLLCRWISTCCIRWLVTIAVSVESHKWPQTGGHTHQHARERALLWMCFPYSILVPHERHGSKIFRQKRFKSLTPSNISHLWVLESSEPGSSWYSSSGIRSYSAGSTICGLKLVSYKF